MLTILETGANLGFAGGNNAGIAHARQLWPDCAVYWLLNADTVVAPDAPAALLDRFDAPDRPDMVGTALFYYHRPDRIQALGGSRLRRWSGTSACLLRETPVEAPRPAPAVIAERIDFVSGASLAVSSRFIDRVGPMSEDYFLYFEEADWAMRARRLARIGYADTVRVWHKEGTTIGSSSLKGGRSLNSEYYLLRSKLIFIRRHFPLSLPTVALYTLGQILARLTRGQRAKARVLLTTLVRGLVTPLPPCNPPQGHRPVRPERGHDAGDKPPPTKREVAE